MKDTEPSPQPSFRVDPRLAWQVVEREAEVAAAAGNKAPASVLSRLLDPVYERAEDPHSRRVGFDGVYLKLFAEWGDVGYLERVVAEFPQVLRAVASIWIGGAERGETAGADLGGAELRDLGILISPHLFSDRPALELFLRRELARISDVLDPAFGHRPGPFLTGRPGALENLARDRLRLLWGISVDGRLAGRWAEYPQLKEERLAEARNHYRSLPASFSERVTDCLWANRRPAFETLRDWACHTEHLVAHLFPEGFDRAHSFIPGTPCPLCRFPVVGLVEQWVGERHEGVLREVLRDFPAWRPEQGACERCVEGYEARLGLWP